MTEPCQHFLGAGWQTGLTVFLPSVICLFALDVLADRVANQPVRVALPPYCEALHALVHFRFDLYGHGNGWGVLHTSRPQSIHNRGHDKKKYRDKDERHQEQIRT